MGLLCNKPALELFTYIAQGGSLMRNPRADLVPKLYARIYLGKVTHWWIGAGAERAKAELPTGGVVVLVLGDPFSEHIENYGEDMCNAQTDF